MRVEGHRAYAEPFGDLAHRGCVEAIGIGDLDARLDDRRDRETRPSWAGVVSP
ncbi:hypothetical protein SDC9_162127 [bioreactor metagenome]|uniref:Uncharacterized protein n=1 Tax=bioreactor metagenome TaxID=1076179 RepID=A0A645FK76_9ZZZZ